MVFIRKHHFFKNSAANFIITAVTIRPDSGIVEVKMNLKAEIDR